MNHKDRLTNWYLQHHGTVLSWAMSHAPSPDTVNDIFQGGYIEFLEDAGDETDPQALLRILRRVVDRVSKRMWRERLKNDPDVLRQIGGRIAELTAARAEKHFYADELAALRHCIDKLPAKSRILIEQHYFVGHSVADIARGFAVTPQAVFKSVAKIRRALRQCILGSLKGDFRHV